MKLITDTFTIIGQVVGEVVHQSNKLVDATIDVASDISEQVSSIPDALSLGYDEELFTNEPTVTSSSEVKTII